MTTRLIYRLRSGIRSLPPLPSVAARLMRLTADPNSDYDALMETVKIDPSLTVDILRLANSVFYGRTMHVDTIKEAVSVLGFTEIRNLVLSEAIFSSFGHLKKDSRFDLLQFWEHSFLCGLAAKVIGNSNKQRSSDYFLVGLIHDLGKLIFLMEIPDLFLDLMKDPMETPVDLIDREKKRLGTTHAEIGALLLRQWLFPKNLVSAVQHHHCPPQNESALLPLIVYLADKIVHDRTLNDPKKGADLDTGVENLLRRRNIQWGQGAVDDYQRQLTMLEEKSADMLHMLFNR